MKLEDLKPNMRVAYAPLHNPAAKEYGTVSSVGTRYAFVRFDKTRTTQACRPEDLTEESSTPEVAPDVTWSKISWAKPTTEGGAQP